MKTVYIKMALVIIVAAFFSMPKRILAAGSDTLTVYASGPSLDEIINSDTTSSGLQAHSVYKLVSLDTTYLFLAPITVKSNFTVIGVPGPNGRPPVIQPGLLSDGSISSILFVLNGYRTTDTFDNLYIFDNSINNSWDWGKVFRVTADSVRLFLNNVIVEDCHGETIPYTGRHDEFYITNCKFLNGVYPSDWFSDVILTPDFPTNNVPDTVVMTDNTFFCLDAGACNVGTSAPLPYLDFSHNTMVYSFTGELNVGDVLNGKIDDNIFYGTDVAGGSNKLFLPENISAISLDTISAQVDPTRKVQVENNIYYEPTAITDFWKAWDDTATVDSIYIPSWMNAQTAAMFSDSEHTRFPGFIQSGNLVNFDPGFGAGLQSIVNNLTGGTTVGLLQYIAEVYTGKISTSTWGYDQQTVGGSNWIPIWPLSAQTSGVLAYSSASDAPDGMPYGDPYWFTNTSTPPSFNVLSKGDSYTATPPASSSYPDQYDTKLTDGIFAPDTGLYSGENVAGDPAWVGFQPTDTENVVINLGKVMSIQQFMGEYLLDPPWGIFLHHTNVSVSTNGTAYTLLDSLSDSNGADTSRTTGTLHKFYLTLPSPVSAQYVKFSTLASKAWVFVDEYEVLGPTVTAVRQLVQTAPLTFALSQNYPNPFNPSTNIQFTVAHSGPTSLRIYNVLGQLVTTLYQGMAQAHENYTFNVSMDRYASGVYFYTLQQGSSILTKKMLLLK